MFARAWRMCVWECGIINNLICPWVNIRALSALQVCLHGQPLYLSILQSIAECFHVGEIAHCLWRGASLEGGRQGANSWFRLSPPRPPWPQHTDSLHGFQSKARQLKEVKKVQRNPESHKLYLHPFFVPFYPADPNLIRGHPGLRALVGGHPLVTSPSLAGGMEALWWRAESPGHQAWPQELGQLLHVGGLYGDHMAPSRKWGKGRRCVWILYMFVAIRT